MTKIKNANQLPKRWYGLHFSEGCAEYHEGPDKSFKILVGEKTIKEMDKSFEGRPVYVNHVDEVDIKDVQNADGYVVKSFYNKSDGKHWVEFMTVSDEALNAIKSGWKLSNAYKITRSGLGGKWHGMDYEQEVLAGEYDHLAIVDEPRYSESIILSPEEFAEYNKNKDAEIIKLNNSAQKGASTMFKFFKKEKVENAIDATMSVILPKSQKEVSLATIINEADEAEVKKDDEVYANETDMVKLGDKSMSVKEIIDYFNELEEKKENEEDEDEEKKENEDLEEDEKKENEEEDKKENEEDEEKKENEEDEEIKKNELAKFNKVKNADLVIFEDEEKVLEIGTDKVARGKARYGSN